MCTPMCAAGAVHHRGLYALPRGAWGLCNVLGVRVGGCFVCITLSLICMYRRVKYLTSDQTCIASYCRVSHRIDVYFVVSTLTAGTGAQADCIT